MTLSTEAVEQALRTVHDPDLQRSVVELGFVKDLRVEGGAVSFAFDLLGSPGGSATRRQRLGESARAAVSAVPGVTSVEVRWQDDVAARAVGPDDPVPTVKNVILVMSGKGGVGKSTVATNLTLALKRAGFRVGLLDADMYGPSVPTMLGITGRPVSLDGKTIEPLERFGVRVMSMGFLLDDPKSPLIWRGPMLHNALQQFIKDVSWGELDFLVLDLPPGTGDVAITLSQRVACTGAVVVTTPQAVATDDVFKSVAMCQRVNIRIIGVVENMSYFVDTAGVRHELFGKGGGQAVAEFSEAPLLGQVPIDQSVREWGDKGTPVVQAAPHSPIATAFVQIAERLVDRVNEMLGDDDDDGAPPVIDRSGGEGGRKRLPLVR